MHKEIVSDCSDNASNVLKKQRPLILGEVSGQRPASQRDKQLRKENNLSRTSCFWIGKIQPQLKSQKWI
ncbi:hypothetical protein GWI33_014776 [Rhynchophorus ferrugineus]|uniref:Uncharacterized protein n=1 Tax=Rhynchophorus ferrugineus TaxID=354439 RepID=A0A834M6K0_RHYFE|nr:hypothetical protein GWI33_014776 [Rhynchophorus ferrugineus]